MTAKQIRKTRFECDSGEWESARWLQEIAAQLAELNERQRRALEPKQIQKLARELITVVK